MVTGKVTLLLYNGDLVRTIMKCVQVLPTSYKEKCIIDIHTEDKTLSLLTYIDIAIFIIMMIIGGCYVPVSEFFGDWSLVSRVVLFFLRLIILACGIIGYVGIPLWTMHPSRCSRTVRGESLPPWCYLKLSRLYGI